MSTPARLLVQYRGHACLNCKTPLEIADRYCHQCGQVNSTKKLALTDFFSEFLSNLISYDSRIWRTISGILFRPGKITKEYCQGRRMHYANPFRFFLTVSIVFFLLIQFMLHLNGSLDKVSVEPGTPATAQLKNNIITSQQNAEELIAIRDSLEKQGDKVSSGVLTQVIGEQEKSGAGKTAVQNYISQQDLDKKNFVDEYLTQTNAYMNHYTDHEDMEVTEALKDLGHRDDKTNRSRYLKAIKFQSIIGDPKQVVPIILPKVPIFLFVFAPVFSFFLWLIYSKTKFNFMEHMVFTFHLFTFIFLSLFILMGLEQATFGWLDLTLIFLLTVGPFYLYKAMRKFYEQQRLRTIVKFIFINFVFFLLFTISSALFVVGSVFVSI